MNVAYTGRERWLVTGACGQLGAHVTRLLENEARSRDLAVLGLGRRRCAGRHGDVAAVDVEDRRALARALDDFRPTHVVHLAGVTSPAAADADPARTWSLAVRATMQIARHVAATGAWMLYTSTDFVWDGAATGRYRENDLPCPATVYGRAKLAGELAVLSSGAGTVARLSLLYGMPVCPRKSSWVHFVQSTARGEGIAGCVDEYRTPVALAEAARIVVELGRLRHRGLLHVAGPDVLTPYDMLVRLADAAGAVRRVRRVSREAFFDGIVRPRNVAMDGSALARLHPSCRAERDVRAGARGQRAGEPRQRSAGAQ